MQSLFILAFLTESFTEYLFGKIAKLEPWKKYLAIAIGVALALTFNVDVFRDILKMTVVVPYVGSIITGAILGRGSNYLHDVVNLVRSISLDNITRAEATQADTAFTEAETAKVEAQTACGFVTSAEPTKEM